jgi:hypothetical protein
VTDVERARRDLLVALIIDFHRNDAGGFEVSSLMQRYSLKSPRLLIEGSIGFWEKFGWVGVDRSTPDFAPRIKVAHYGEALEQLLCLLKGTQFDVFWQHGRVLTDGTAIDDIPIPMGWELATFEKPSLTPSSDVPVRAPTDWTKWGAILAAVGILVAILIAVIG